MSFRDEIEQYSIDDLELIIETQEDLYSEQEMSELKSLLREKQEIEKQKKLLKMPKIIKCQKCDGPNDFQNDTCVFCGNKLDKNKYLNGEYEEDAENEQMQEMEQSFMFHYIISFLIPFVGYIVGAVMLASNDKTKVSSGKVCIILAIISTVLAWIIVCRRYMIWL